MVESKAQILGPVAVQHIPQAEHLSVTLEYNNPLYFKQKNVQSYNMQSSPTLTLSLTVTLWLQVNACTLNMACHELYLYQFSC